MAGNPHGCREAQVSILVPTYNESKNIVGFLKSIGENLPKDTATETIVIDDNSPDGTGRLVDDYIKNVKEMANHTIDIIHRKAKQGLSSAILHGIQHANGDTIVVMDGDFSHPPSTIPNMIESLRKSQCDIVVASRYITGGKIQGWSLKRKFLSRIATNIAKRGLGVDQHDPMSGFFAFKKTLINGLKFDGIGYKILLEFLVKTKGASVREIPYTFRNRQLGCSKLGLGTILDYVHSVWKLYRFGKKSPENERRSSVKFLSKAARFYTVGATGLAINYAFSTLFAGGIIEFWYLHANLIGILTSMSTNFVLNKYWTFGDRSFRTRETAVQYGKFIMFSSAGALVQLGMVYLLVESYSVAYPAALVVAVLAAAFGNFVLNKRWTFREKLWP